MIEQNVMSGSGVRCLTRKGRILHSSFFILHSSFFILLLLIAGCQRSTPEPILIGHVAALSGSTGATGRHAKQGILLAVEEAANKGENRIDGRRVEVLHVDSHGDKDRVQNEAARLVTVNHIVALIGGANPGEVEVLTPVAQQHGIPLITPTEQLQSLSASESKTSGTETAAVFSLDVAPAYRGQMLAQFTVQDLKVGSVVVLKDQRSEAGKVVAAAFVKEIKGVPVQEHAFQSGDEFDELVNRCKNAKPGAIFMTGTASDLTKLITKLRAAGVEVPTVFGGGEKEVAALLNDKDKQSGVVVATAYLTADGTLRDQEFVKTYQERFNEAPDLHAALGYASARVLIDSMLKAKTPAPKKVGEELDRLSGCESMIGPLSFGKDHTIRRPLFIIRREADGAKEVRKFEPADR